MYFKQKDIFGGMNKSCLKKIMNVSATESYPKFRAFSSSEIFSIFGYSVILGCYTNRGCLG